MNTEARLKAQGVLWCFPPVLGCSLTPRPRAGVKMQKGKNIIPQLQFFVVLPGLCLWCFLLSPQTKSTMMRRTVNAIKHYFATLEKHPSILTKKRLIIGRKTDAHNQFSFMWLQSKLNPLNLIQSVLRRTFKLLPVCANFTFHLIRKKKRDMCFQQLWFLSWYILKVILIPARGIFLSVSPDTLLPPPPFLHFCPILFNVIHFSRIQLNKTAALIQQVMVTGN